MGKKDINNITADDIIADFEGGRIDPHGGAAYDALHVLIARIRELETEVENLCYDLREAGERD